VNVPGVIPVTVPGVLAVAMLELLLLQAEEPLKFT
jgi:hypothetical protein